MEPFIDNHCHSFAKDFETEGEESRRRCFTESRSTEHVEFLIAYRHAMSQTAGRIEQILPFRDVAAMIVDDGFAADDMLSLEKLQSVLGDSTQVFRCKRIEPILEKHLADKPTYSAFCEAVFSELFENYDQVTSVALKTIMAYRGGLTLDTVTHEESKADFEIARNDFRAGMKRIERRPLYHYMLYLIFKETRGLPVQIHCGLGDDDALMVDSNPALFQPVLKRPEMRDTDFVFLHCFPYVREAATLASLYPNVFFDLSLTIPLGSPLAKDLILEALSIAPTTKLLAGTDGHSHPGMHSYAATIWRSALTAALESLKARGFIDDEEHTKIERRVLHRNATNLYRRLGMRL